MWSTDSLFKFFFNTLRNIVDSDLFGPSNDGDLFDDLSSPFGKKGGMFSGGSGLFDDVNDDDEGGASVKVCIFCLSAILIEN